MATNTDQNSKYDFSEFDDELVREFLHRRSREVSDRTVEGDVTTLRQYVEILGEKSADESSYGSVVEYADCLVDRNVTEETLRVYISTISKLHEYLNHFHRANMPDVSKIPNRYHDFGNSVERKPIGPDEVEKLIEAGEDLRESLIIAITYFEGLRASETANIKLRDLKLNEGVVEITDSKNSKSRTLSIHEKLNLLIRIWLNEERPSYPTPDSDYLFVGPESEKIDKGDVWQIVHDAAERADLQRIIGERADGRPIYRVKPHVLRHSFATHAFDDGEGMEIEDLSIFLGHDDTRTTKDYIHKYTEESANDSFDSNFDPF